MGKGGGERNEEKAFSCLERVRVAEKMKRMKFKVYLSIGFSREFQSMKI